MQETNPTVLQENISQIETILRKCDYLGYRDNRDYIVAVAPKHDLARKFPATEILEKMYQNDLAGKENLREGLSREENQFLDS